MKQTSLVALLSLACFPMTAIATEDGAVRVGEATVVQADVDASNGVIHVIDQVLLPPS